MRGQNNLSAHQVRDGITQAPQFVSRQQAFWESQLEQESPQGVTCISLQCRKLAFHAVMLRPGREGIAGSGGGAELLIQLYKRLAVCLHVRCIRKRDQRLKSILGKLQVQVGLVFRRMGQRDLHLLLPVLDHIQRAVGIRHLRCRYQYPCAQEQQQETEAERHAKDRMRTQQAQERPAAYRLLQVQRGIASQDALLQLPGVVRVDLQGRRSLEAKGKGNERIGLWVLAGGMDRRQEPVRCSLPRAGARVVLLKPLIEPFRQWLHSVSSSWRDRWNAYACSGERGVPSTRCKRCNARNCNALTALACLPSMR